MVRIKKAVICSVLVFVVLFGFSIGTVALAQTPATEQEEEAKPTLSASYTFFSQYIWRGYELSKDSLVMFPSITVSYKCFSLNVWGDYDTHYEGTGHKEWWETDFVFSYSNNLGNTLRLGNMWDKFKNFNYTIGYIYYDTNADNYTYITNNNIYRRGRKVCTSTKVYHPGTGDNEEIFAILGYSCFGNPSISVWRQIEDGEEWYFNFALSQNFPICPAPWAKDWSIDVGAWVSYYDREANYEKTAYSAMHDGNVWAALNIPLNKYFTLSPTIQYSAPLSNNAQQELEAGSFSGEASRFLYGGLVFKVAF